MIIAPYFYNQGHWQKNATLARLKSRVTYVEVRKNHDDGSTLSGYI